MPLCGIVKGLRLFHQGITWDREGDRKFLFGVARDPEGHRTHVQIGVCGTVRGSYPCGMPLCWIVRNCFRDHVGCEGIVSTLSRILRGPDGDRANLQR